MGCELKSNRPVHGCYCCSVTALCLTVCHSSWFDCLHQAPPSFIISQSLLKFMSIDLVMLFKHLILCCLLILKLRGAQYILSVLVFYFSLGYFWPQILFPLNLTELWSWLWPLALKEEELCLSGAMPQAVCKSAGRDYFPGCAEMTFWGEWVSAVHVNSFSHDWEP